MRMNDTQYLVPVNDTQYLVLVIRKTNDFERLEYANCKRENEKCKRICRERDAADDASDRNWVERGHPIMTPPRLRKVERCRTTLDEPNLVA